MPRILIVEDEAHILRVTSMWLRRHGYELCEASNGAEALAILDQHDPASRFHQVDLIISDMNMPVMTGLELLKTVREDHKSDVPFILLTARCDQQELATELAPYGARLYPKPFVPSRLVTDVEAILKAQETKGATP